MTTLLDQPCNLDVLPCIVDEKEGSTKRLDAINEIVERKRRKERSFQMSKSPYTYDHTLGIDNERDFNKAITQECTSLYKIHHKSKDNHVVLSISWHQCN